MLEFGVGKYKFLDKEETAKNIQEKWNQIVKANVQAAETILGFKKRKGRSNNE